MHAQLEAKIKADPDNTDIKMALAAVYAEGREHARAIAIYAEVSAVRPDDLRVVTELCALLTEMRDSAKAGPYCERAVAIAPENPLVHDNLGLYHFKFGRFRQALKPFLDALSLQSGMALPRLHIIRTFLALKEPRLARDHALKSLRRDDWENADRAFLHFVLAESYRALEDYAPAFTAMRETYRLSGNPLYLGKVVTAFLAAHPIASFLPVGLITLVAADYLGRRLNRFLRNE